MGAAGGTRGAIVANGARAVAGGNSFAFRTAIQTSSAELARRRRRLTSGGGKSAPGTFSAIGCGRSTHGCAISARGAFDRRARALRTIVATGTVVTVSGGVAARKSVVCARWAACAGRCACSGTVLALGTEHARERVCGPLHTAEFPRRARVAGCGARGAPIASCTTGTRAHAAEITHCAVSAG